MSHTTITIEHDGKDGERAETVIDCYSLSIWKKNPKELFVAGTLETLSHVRTWLGEKSTRIKLEAETLSPCPDGYRLAGGRQIARGKHIAMFRSLDRWCIWDCSDAGVYNKLVEQYTTPLLPEWIAEARQTMRQWILPLWGFHEAGSRIDGSLLPAVFDQHICKLVKRKLLTI